MENGGNRPPWEDGSGDSLRDWQKNTWYGPTPVNDNPFEEPEDAPELISERSDNLNDRSGQFWQKQTIGYQAGATQPTEPPPPEKKKRRWGPLIFGTLAGAAVLVAVLYYGVFVVRSITVTGNSALPAEEIIRLSGIRKGQPILSVSGEAVEAGLKQNPMLKYRYVEKRLPGEIILAVREREACCWMTWNGILYTMDKQRMILFETEDMSVQPAKLVRVNGLRIRGGSMVGQTLVLESAWQEAVFSNLFLEMKVLNCTELIAEANLSSPESILLTTRDGFTVSMGGADNIHAKLRSMLLTREELVRRGYSGGVINVSLPETPLFSPPQQ